MAGDDLPLEGDWRRFKYTDKVEKTYVGNVREVEPFPGLDAQGRRKARLWLVDIFEEAYPRNPVPSALRKKHPRHPEGLPEGHSRTHPFQLDPDPAEDLRPTTDFLEKLPAANGGDLARWVSNQAVTLRGEHKSYHVCYVIIHEAAKRMDCLLKEFQEHNGIEPLQTGPNGHLRRMDSLGLEEHDLLKHKDFYNKFGDERNDNMHNPGCEMSGGVAVKWLRMLGNDLLLDCCDVEDALLSDLKEKLDLLGKPQAIRVKTPPRIQVCKELVGRGWLFDRVRQELLKDDVGSVLLEAEGGFGKVCCRLRHLSTDKSCLLNARNHVAFCLRLYLFVHDTWDLRAWWIDWA